MKVLVADDDLISRGLVKALLLKWGYEVTEVNDGNTAWNVLQQKDSPRLVLLDWMMPGLDGVELCRRLRGSVGSGYHYVILLTSRDSKADVISGLNAGADDYIIKPFISQELEVRLRAGCRILKLQRSLEEALETQRYQATHDSLTRLLNHGEIFKVLEKELCRASRQGTPLAVLMGDLDHFKKVNDTYGHLAGDAVLVEVAARMQNSIRLYDAVGRYGGEEFLFVLPGCRLDEALLIAGRILAGIREQPVGFRGIPIDVTISLGVAARADGGQPQAIDLVQAADAALYRAKLNGRNRAEPAAPVIGRPAG